MLADAIRILRCSRCGLTLFEPKVGERTNRREIISILEQHKQECKGRTNGTERGSVVP